MIRSTAPSSVPVVAAQRWSSATAVRRTSSIVHGGRAATRAIKRTSIAAQSESSVDDPPPLPARRRLSRETNSNCRPRYVLSSRSACGSTSVWRVAAHSRFASVASAALLAARKV